MWLLAEVNAFNRASATSFNVLVGFQAVRVMGVRHRMDERHRFEDFAIKV